MYEGISDDKRAGSNAMRKHMYLAILHSSAKLGDFLFERFSWEWHHSCLSGTQQTLRTAKLVFDCWKLSLNLAVCL